MFNRLPEFNSPLLLMETAPDDIRQGYYSKIPYNEFNQIILADPTTLKNPNGEPRKMGNYSKWLLGLYQKKTLKLEDLYKATASLKIFEKVKNKLPVNQRNIVQYKNLQDLFTVTDPYESGKEDTRSNADIEREIKNNGADKIYDDGEWTIIHPKTREAACYYGKGTKWCTAATEEENNMFDSYNNQGPLYIFINRQDLQKKYQLHAVEGQFMNVRDEEASLDDVPTHVMNALRAYDPDVEKFVTRFASRDSVLKTSWDSLNDDERLKFILNYSYLLRTYANNTIDYVSSRDFYEWFTNFLNKNSGLTPLQLDTIHKNDGMEFIGEYIMHYYKFLKPKVLENISNYILCKIIQSTSLNQNLLEWTKGLYSVDYSNPEGEIVTMIHLADKNLLLKTRDWFLSHEKEIINYPILEYFTEKLTEVIQKMGS